MRQSWNLCSVVRGLTGMRSILAIFDELERLQRGGVGILPEPTVEEIIKRLRHRYESSADENSPSLASWASPST